MNKRKGSIFVYTLFAAMAGLLFGFDTGNISGALPFIQSQFHASTITVECIVSITIFFAFISALLTGHFVERYGRRFMLIIAALLFTCGALLGSIAHSIIEMIIARSLLGIAIGISSYTAPLYISEISPPQYRGSLIMLNGISITGGQTTAFLLDYFFSKWSSWRPMLALGAVPSIILLISLYWLPSSPRWLIIKNRITQAKKILRKIRSQYDIEDEINQIINTVKSCKNKFNVVKSDRATKKILFIGIILGFLQQFSGINTIMYYGPILFKLLYRYNIETSISSTFIMGFTNFIVTILVVYLIDRVGRKKLLVIGSGLSGISLFSMSLLIHIGVKNQLTLEVVFVLMINYIIGYCLGIGSLFWVIISEIFPLESRGKMMCIATAFQWLANFLIVQFFLSSLKHFGISKVFFFYSLICFFTLFFSYYFIPETKNITLEEIENKVRSRYRRDKKLNHIASKEVM